MEPDLDKDDWIEWYGGKCPVHPETRVDVTFMDGKVFRDGYALEWDWEWGYGGGNLVAYRVVTPNKEEVESLSTMKDEEIDYSDIPPSEGLKVAFKKYERWGKYEALDNPYKRACPYDTIDIYRVLQVYEVTDPCIQHAIKKLLCAGQRGYKEVERDVQEAIQSLQRWEEMRREETSD